MKSAERKGFQAVTVLLFILLCLLPGGRIRAEEETHTLEFFFENVCASCHEEDNFYDLFNRCISAEEKAAITYEIRIYNVFQSVNRETYEKTLAENGKTAADFSLPVLYIDGQWLSGYAKIEEQLHDILIEGKQAADQTSAEEQHRTVPAEAEDTSEATSFDPVGNDKDAEDAALMLPAIDADTDESAVLLFTTYSCDDCQEVKEYLNGLQETTEFTLTEANVAEGNNILLFKELLKVYGREEADGKVPAVFAGSRALLGKEEIREELPGLIEEGGARYDELKEALSHVSQETEITAANLATLFAAGLLAGFNPCAISMLLMLFSILLTTKASVLKNGILYLTGKYITYLGLGFGICFAASRVDQNLLGSVGRMVNIILIILFLFVAVMNFVDFLNVRKAEYGKVRMQLPRKLRHFNHQLLKKSSRMEGAFLGVVVLGLGVAISLGEFFCTGQIYMASILYLLRNAREQLAVIFGTLLVYVTAMSLPAVVILGLIARTKGTGRVSDFMLKHMGAIKLLNCVLFLFYALYFIRGL